MSQLSNDIEAALRIYSDVLQQYQTVVSILKNWQESALASFEKAVSNSPEVKSVNSVTVFGQCRVEVYIKVSGHPTELLGEKSLHFCQQLNMPDPVYEWKGGPCFTSKYQDMDIWFAIAGYEYTSPLICLDPP